MIRFSCIARALACAFVVSSVCSVAEAAQDMLPRHAVFGAAVTSNSDGVVVTAVFPDTSASRGGLHVNDVIKSIDHMEIDGIARFLAIVRAERAGKTIPVEILRDRQSTSLSLTLRPAPDEHEAGLHTLYKSVLVDGTERRTLVSVPDGVSGKLPAVLLLGGIGCYTVDDATNADDGYLRVMHDITNAGFVTMRLEKSGVGDSQGPPCHDVDFISESHSYDVALAALRKDPRVDASRIYLFGHSIGTAIAPKLALEHPVAGIIFSEGFARDWFDYEMENLRRQLELGGDAPDVVDAKLLSKAHCMERLLYEHEMESDIERSDPSCKTRNRIYPVEDAYVQQVAALNVIAPWERISVPVLAVFGTSDFVVSPDDARRIVSVVNANHSGDATLQIVAGMTHMLLRAETPEIAMNDSEAKTPEHYSSGFSKVVVAWLCNHERCRDALLP